MVRQGAVDSVLESFSIYSTLPFANDRQLVNFSKLLLELSIKGIKERGREGESITL